MAGAFIVLEGIDGAGKTVQAELLCAWLRGRGHTVVETREPTDGEWGRKYRSWARGEFEASADEVLEFFVRDRREHVEALIAPALARGEIVVCDRYAASTLAYQAAHGVDRDALTARFAKEAFPLPDLTLWLRIDIGDAIARMGSEAVERFERAEFLTRVDDEYARQDGLVEVDASGRIHDVQARLRARVEARLGQR